MPDAFLSAAAMKTVRLFEEAKRFPPGEQAAYIRTRLSACLAGSPISMWHPLGQDLGVGSRVVLGIAPYSLPDLELVDTLMDALSEDRPKYGELVQLFDIMACTNMRDFEDRIPGIGEVFQTPVVGIWEGGALVGKGTGAKARQLIAERFRLRD